jgi:hypothetical protein
MGRMLLVTALIAAITVPLAGAADPPGDGTLSVKRGRGALVLKLKGTVIGRVKNGRVQIRDFRPLDANDPKITCPRNRIRHVGAGIWICKGRNISFRVDDARFNVNVRGTGIWISAVGRGPGTVDGMGEDGVPDGVMSIDDAPYASLPDALMSFLLGTPASPARG